MTTLEKLIDRFLTIPTDFTFNELERLLRNYGYSKSTTGKTSGSVVHFIDDSKNTISIHKPHPENIVKQPYLKEIVKHLKRQGKLL